MVITETIIPLIILSGPTQIITKVTISVIDALIAVPIAIIASNGILYNFENAGIKYKALNAVPNTAIQSVPTTQAIIAAFLLFFK